MKAVPRKLGADIVVIGGSAGSRVPLCKILARLDKDFTATVFVVQHSSLAGWAPESSAKLLEANSALPVHVVANLQPFHRGQVYVCPPNQHLVLENGHMCLEESPIENHTRPSIDVLFRSAAASYGRRVIGVILSGTLTDGTAGLWQIKKRGGLAIVQEPSDAEFPHMPRSAIQNTTVDYVLTADTIGEKLTELVGQRLSAAGCMAGPPRILIVEDEALVAQNLEEQLQELSYTVCDSVPSGEEAVVAAMEKNPELVLMDIQLAGKMNGIAAAMQIWERLQIPVVFITAHADLQTLAAVKMTENYGYVVKPFHTASLQAAVELALDRREKELRHKA